MSAAKRPTPVLATLVLACVAFSLSQTLVVPALPALAREFDASQSAVSWVLTGFLLSASVATPIVGKLGDLYGKGRMLTVVLALFSVGAVINALAGSIEVVIAGRVLQGVAGGVFPLAFGIVRDTFPREHIPGGLSIVSAVFGIGGGIGLPLSGVIVDNVDLQWLFWINLIALPAAFAAHRLVPPSPPVPNARVDWLGGAAAVGRAGRDPARRLAGGRVGLGVAEERRRDRRRAGPGRAVRRGRGARAPTADRPPRAPPAGRRGDQPHRLPGRRGDVLELPDHALVRAGAGEIGLRLRVHGHPGGAAADADRARPVAAGPPATKIAARIGFRALLSLGAVFISLSFLINTFAHSHPWELVVGGILLGAGITFAFAAMANLIVEAVPQGEVGIATGINTVMRTVGGSFGAAIATAILTGSVAAGSSLPTEGAYTTAFAFSAAAGVLALAASRLVPRGRPRMQLQPVTE